ncbi:hypothetical protein ASF37_11695 [Aeromicrobium sp. Leaf289]|uniref:hypothetical protein n=1 Tax=Aeromicrobium sp. Leaf289 TaxID=1736324 RepID=UPI0006F7E593|nr:hypothetical protein [Aeromicrobium sp. Leaf289]KQP77220.1 hypothetical protein ASF37_11695 [Aeromicrobium sp. Leaf289]
MSATPSGFDDVPAALEAEHLLAAFSNNDTAVLSEALEPEPEVIAALLIYTTLAIKMLAEVHPTLTEQSVRSKLRRQVAELLASNEEI